MPVRVRVWLHVWVCVGEWLGELVRVWVCGCVGMFASLLGVGASWAGLSLPIDSSRGTHWFGFSGGVCLHCVSQAREGHMFGRWEWDGFSLLTGAVSALRCPSHAWLTFSHAHDRELWRVLSTASDVGNGTQGQGVPDHRVLHTSGAQHCQKGILPCRGDVRVAPHCGLWAAPVCRGPARRKLGSPLWAAFGTVPMVWG